MHDKFKRLTLMYIGILASSFIVYTLLLNFLNGALEKKNGEISDLRLQLSQNSRISETLAKYKETAPRAQKYEIAINQFLPDQYQVISFKNWIETVGKIRQLEVASSFRTDSVDKTFGTIGAIPFNLSVRGKFDAARQYLLDIESNNPHYLVEVQNVQMTKDKDIYNFQIQARVFIRT